MLSELKDGMLRKRKEKMGEVTDQMWSEVCEFNRTLAEEFWNESVHLSPKVKNNIFQH